MTKKMVAALSREDGVPSDRVVEAFCDDGDAMVLSQMSQFYKGPHPVVFPKAFKLLKLAATLYAMAFLYRRDPTFGKTYINVNNSPEYKQAESIMKGIQTDSRCLYDNDNQPFIGAGVVSPSLSELENAPQLFGRDYCGDL